MSKANAKPAVEQAQPAARPGAAEIRQAMAEALPPIAALLASQCKARESGVYFNTFEVVPNAGTPFEHVVRRDFWANVSQRMKPGDTLIVFPRDGAWYAELAVWDAGQNWADVSVKAKLDRPALNSAPGVEIDFDIRRDPIDGICVVRRSSGAKVKSNFPNHEDARRWILDHQRALRN